MCRAHAAQVLPPARNPQKNRLSRQIYRLNARLCPNTQEIYVRDTTKSRIEAGNQPAGRLHEISGLVGFALFYLREAPESVTTMQIYRGVVPFVTIQALALIVLWFLPKLATSLPDKIFGA